MLVVVTGVCDCDRRRIGGCYLGVCYGGDGAHGVCDFGDLYGGAEVQCVILAIVLLVLVQWWLLSWRQYYCIQRLWSLRSSLCVGAPGMFGFGVCDSGGGSDLVFGCGADGDCGFACVSSCPSFRVAPILVDFDVVVMIALLLAVVLDVNLMVLLLMLVLFLRLVYLLLLLMVTVTFMFIIVLVVILAVIYWLFMVIVMVALVCRSYLWWWG
jgi:hypothetical protein